MRSLVHLFSYCFTKAKTFCLYQFGKLITLINIDWKAKLDRESDQCTEEKGLIIGVIKQLGQQILQLKRAWNQIVRKMSCFIFL